MTQQGAATFNLNDQRFYLKESTTGNTVQVPADTYLSHYTSLLPSQRDTDDLVSHVERKLKATGPSKALTSNGWVATNVKGPTEDRVFKRLEDIAESIHDHCVEWNKTKQHPKLRKRTTRLICRPGHTTASEVRGGSMRTDARFILLEEEGEEVDSENVPTSAVAGPAEFKCQLTAEFRIDNESKVLGAVGHIIYADPCRRSVMAFTIEDRLMRFWYFSRSHITVSAEFDYHANPRLFIRFVIFMTFASLEDLGYDPTVKRIHVSKEEIQYRFTVGDKVYQTTGVIHEMNLDIVTRATRVWEVVELGPGDVPIGGSKVLKDVWLYFDAKPESDIYNEIFAALRQLDEAGSVPESERPPPLQPGSSLEEDAKHYFMTIVSDSIVMINGQPDEAQEPPAGYLEFFYTEEEEKVAKEATIEGSQRGDVDGCTPKLKRADGAAYPHKKRTHRRIVFEEVCRTLYKVLSYADFAKGLAQLVYGNPGNCLIYKGQTKISDLEYARPYAAPGHGAAPLTGTPGFMAVEYQVGRHLFELPRVLVRIRHGKPPPPDQVDWFKFNFLHDLESVIWIYLWFLLETLPESFTPAEVVRHKKPILSLYHMLFDGSLRGSADRRMFMEHCATVKGREYKEVISALTEVHGVDSMIPKALQAFQCLAGCYGAVESSKPLFPESPHMTHWDRKVFLHEFYEDIHFYFMDVHEQMKEKTDTALPIWYTDQEAKHRAQQAAGPSKKRSAGTGRNKRPRTGTGRDSEPYVPPVVADEDEESDSDSDEPPSPTEESQKRKVVAGKRKRGGRA
ncbi:hypothetical protein BDZ89DRAFT_1063276 [Hymenopellis radicata]|nr:hypothetical protein BDZ89DRAFT_1063276 [Hymenopellis radicata]